MQTRVAIVGILVTDTAAAGEIQHILSEYGSYIIGRMGIPYRERGLHIISVAVDASADVINAMTGRIGRLPGVSAKAVYSNA